MRCRSVVANARVRDTWRAHFGPLLAAVLALALAPGCGLEPLPPQIDDETADSDGTGWDDWSVLYELANGAYRDSFVRVSSAPYPSDLTELSIDVWVSEVGRAEYLQIEPEGAAAPGLELPVGTIVVRELVDDDGAIASLTVLARGPDGYSPGHGDLWYGTLQPDAWPEVDEQGRELIGARVEECTSCHDDRASQAYVFGVPDEYRRAELP